MPPNNQVPISNFSYPESAIPTTGGISRPLYCGLHILTQNVHRNLSRYIDNVSTSNAHVHLLQEVGVLNPALIQHIHTHTPYTLHYKNDCKCAILVHNSIQAHVVSSCVFSLTIKLFDDLYVTSFYGSNRSDERPPRFDMLSSLKNMYPRHIFGGDWNFISNGDLDAVNVTASYIQRLLWSAFDLTALHLIDTFRFFHPSARAYTRVRGYDGKTRLDMLFITHAAAQFMPPIHSCHIDFGTAVSDHVGVRTTFAYPRPLPPLHLSSPKTLVPIPITAAHVRRSSLPSLSSVRPYGLCTHFVDAWQFITKQIHRTLRLRTMAKVHTATPPNPFRTALHANDPKFLHSISNILSPSLPLDCLFDPCSNSFVHGHAAAQFGVTSFIHFGHQTPGNWSHAQAWLSHHPPSNDPFLPFTMPELGDAMNSFKLPKASGPDQVPVWLLKHLPSHVHDYMLSFTNHLLTHDLPSFFGRTWIKFLYKGSGDPTLLPMHRPISLSTSVYMLQATLLLSRLKHELTRHPLHPFQMANAQHTSCLHAVSRLLLQASALPVQTRPHLVSFDIRKAFDSLDLPILWRILESRGISPALIRAIQHLYANCSFSTLIGPHSSFTPRGPKGVKQGCPLSMLLFNIFCDALVERLASISMHLSIIDLADGVGVQWADDTSAVVPEHHVHTVISVVLQFAEDFGLDVHLLKTVVLNLTSTHTRSWSVRNTTITSLPNTHTHKVLGVFISGTPTSVHDAVVTELRRTLDILTITNLGPSERAKVVNAKILPRLSHRLALFASESWVRDIQQELDRWVRHGGTVTLDAGSKHLHTPHSLGGYGMHYLQLRLQLQLFRVIYTSLLPPPSPTHPLTSIHTLTKKMCYLIRDNPSLHNRTLNPVSQYVRLIQLLGLQTPITGQPELTHYFIPPPPPLPPPFYQQSGEWYVGQCVPTNNFDTHPLVALPPHVSERLTHMSDTFPGTVVYTDGSFKDSTAGAGVCFPSMGLQAMKRPTGLQTSGRGELTAALGALELNPYPTQPLLILTDYMGLVHRSHSLLNIAPHSMYRWKNRDLWLQLQSRWSPLITVAWVPGHKGILGNERADSLAEEARGLPLPTTSWWLADMWRVFLQSTEVTPDLSHIALSKFPILQWHDVNICLSFANVSRYTPTLRFKWLWGRTHWEGTAPYWHRDVQLPCPFTHLCPSTCGHFTDLFSVIAECPAFNMYRTTYFQLWGQASGLVQQWFTAASAPDKRNFLRTLIPNSLVTKFLQHISPQRIRTFVTARDTGWPQATKHLRQVYGATLQHQSQLTPLPAGQADPPDHLPP
jgi:ribonuclease HI